MAWQEVKAVLGEVIALTLLGIVAYVILRRDTSSVASAVSNALPTTQEVSDSITAIVSQGPSALKNVVTGVNDTGYITRDQQTAMAKANLARRLAQQGATAQ